MVKRAAEWRRSKCSTRLSNQTVLQTRMRSRKIAIARRCRRDPASAYPAIRDGWRASAPAPHDRGPHLAFNRGDFAMNAGFVAGFVGDAETHGLQHPGVALVERHPFFARGFNSIRLHFRKKPFVAKAVRCDLSTVQALAHTYRLHFVCSASV